MKKKTAYLILTIATVTGISVPSFAAANGRNYANSTLSLKSKNTLKYSGSNGKIELYADDLALLADKVVTIPDKIFDPNVYAHSHIWEYIDINDQTHKKHCAECGSDNDLTNKHTAFQQETCNISYGDSIYAGAIFTCECGYQWTKERYHNYEYAYADDNKHLVTCALNGTEYCSGFQTYSKDHFFEGVVSNDDNMHHTSLCAECGYERMEACDYTDYFKIDDDSGETLWYCQCGNWITEPNVPNTDANDDGTDDTDIDSDHDTGSDTDADQITDLQTSTETAYVSNNDGTHKVIQGEDILKLAETCTLIADLETYDDATGQAAYTCELCNYSIVDTYNPDERE